MYNYYYSNNSHAIFVNLFVSQVELHTSLLSCIKLIMQVMTVCVYCHKYIIIQHRSSYKFQHAIHVYWCNPQKNANTSVCMLIMSLRELQNQHGTILVRLRICVYRSTYRDTIMLYCKNPETFYYSICEKGISMHTSILTIIIKHTHTY